MLRVAENVPEVAERGGFRGRVALQGSDGGLEMGNGLERASRVREDETQRLEAAPADDGVPVNGLVGGPLGESDRIAVFALEPEQARPAPGELGVGYGGLGDGLDAVADLALV